MNILKTLNKEKIKQLAIKSLKKWLCGKLPMPEQHETIELKRTVDINEWTCKFTERILMEDMIQELNKDIVVFTDIELPDGGKRKQAILKVVKPK